VVPGGKVALQVEGQATPAGNVFTEPGPTTDTARVGGTSSNATPQDRSRFMARVTGAGRLAQSPDHDATRHPRLAVACKVTVVEEA
jgi:hypothetical protein